VPAGGCGLQRAAPAPFGRGAGGGEVVLLGGLFAVGREVREGRVEDGPVQASVPVGGVSRGFVPLQRDRDGAASAGAGGVGVSPGRVAVGGFVCCEVHPQLGADGVWGVPVRGPRCGQPLRVHQSGALGGPAEVGRLCV